MHDLHQILQQHLQAQQQITHAALESYSTLLNEHAQMLAAGRETQDRRLANIEELIQTTAYGTNDRALKINAGLDAAERRLGEALDKLATVETVLIGMHRVLGEMVEAVAGNNARFDRIDAACGEAYLQISAEVRNRTLNESIRGVEVKR